jgi:bile acid:Na+ symporter, BASS family
MDNRYFPLVVVVVMLALGLTLTVADFQRAATLRRPLLVALVCQSLVLPTLCLLIAEVFHLEPNLAVGLMLMAATPGGTMANILSHLVNGDLALNLTLTAINAVLSMFALPTILALSMGWFIGEGRFIPLQLDKFLGVFGLVLIPTALGVAIRHRFPELARRLQKPVRIAAAVLLVLVVLAAIAGGRTTLWNNFGVLSGAVATFCAVSLTVGYLVPRRMHLAPRGHRQFGDRTAQRGGGDGRSAESAAAEQCRNGHPRRGLRSHRTRPCSDVRLRRAPPRPRVSGDRCLRHPRNRITVLAAASCSGQTGRELR